jgi:hypothetical protein
MNGSLSSETFKHDMTFLVSHFTPTLIKIISLSTNKDHHVLHTCGLDMTKISI